MIVKLLRLYVRDSWNSRMLAFFLAVLLLTAFLLWFLPTWQPEQSSFFAPVSLAFVDHDRSFISRLMVDQFRGFDYVASIYVETLAEAEQRLAQNEVLLIIIIPEGFYEQSTRGQQRDPIIVHLNDRMPTETAIFLRLIRNLADSIVATQSAFFAFYDFLLPLYEDGAAMTKSVDAAFTTLFFRLIGRKSMLDIAEGQALSTTRFVVSALLCLLTMITTLPILLLIQQDRRSGLQDRLVAAHVGWHHFFLARQLTGLIWLAASFVPILTALFHLYPAMDRLAAIIAILTLYWSTATLAQAVGLIFAPGEPVVLAAWLGILALLLLGGCIYPRQLLPDILRQISRAVPPAWAQQQLYRALAGQTSSLPDLVLPTLPALAAAVAVYWGWRRCRRSSEV